MEDDAETKYQQATIQQNTPATELIDISFDKLEHMHLEVYGKF